MEQFQPGERITAHIPDLTVSSVRVDDGDTAWVHVSYFGNNGDIVDLALPVGTGIRFERVTPADGEPQPGEVWSDQVDGLYFVCQRDGKAKLVSMEQSPSYHLEWLSVHCGPTGPIYRVAQRPQIGGQS